ncbi:MAG: FHA domain-containing protein [Myxococcota bacterium]
MLRVVRGLTDPQDGVRLKPEGIVTIGRAGTLKVHDELVSIHHAQVFYDEAAEHYVIRDLDSSSGTVVDGDTVRNDSRPLKPGSVLRFGNVVLRVEAPRKLPRWLPLAALVVFMTFFGVILLWMIMPRWQEPSLRLQSKERIWTPEGSASEVAVPQRWLLRHGHPWNLRLLKVTDYDADDLSELWINVDNAKLAIVTFDADGRWIDLGELPFPYRVVDPMTTPGHFPLLEANGEVWQLDAALRQYHPIDMQGAVVFYREEARPEPKKDDKEKGKAGKAKAPEPAHEGGGFGGFGLGRIKPLKVGRFNMRDKERMAQFFVDRGIYGKVHYVICEGAFEGIHSAVLTADNVVREPNPGCIDELRLDGAIQGTPYAVAFTPAGHQALVDDVVTFYAGEPTGLFLSEEDAEKVKVLRTEPGPPTPTSFLVAEKREGGGVVGIDPVANMDARLPAAPRPLDPTDRPYRASPPAEVLTLSEPGEYELVAPTGERFRVGVSERMVVSVSQIVDGKPTNERSCRPDQLRPVRWKVGEGEVQIRMERYTRFGEDRLQRVRVGYRPL